MRIPTLTPTKAVWALLLTGFGLAVLAFVLSSGASRLTEAQTQMVRSAANVGDASPETALGLIAEAKELGAWVNLVLDLSTLTNVAGVLCLVASISMGVVQGRRERRDATALNLAGHVGHLMDAVQELAAREDRGSELLAKAEEERRKTQTLIDTNPEQWEAITAHGRPARRESRLLGIIGIVLGVPGFVILVWTNFDRIVGLLQ